MTTQTTTIQPTTKSMRALIGATAVALAVLGGALLWQGRPTSEPVTPAIGTTSSTLSEGAAPLGGLAERYLEEQRAEVARQAARVTTTGGMAELYAEQEADARASVERESRMGGMAQLYRDQATAARGAP